MKHKERGITLVELMVALAVSGILLAGVGIIYGNSKRTYNVDEEFARLQENARIAMKYLVEDIRMAGNLGCTNNDGTAGKVVCNVATTSDYICTNPTAGLGGYEAKATGIATGIGNTTYTLTMTTDPALTASTATAATAEWNTNGTTGLPAGFPTSAVLGSDIIVVHHADNSVFKLNADKATGAGSAFAVIDAASALTAGDILIASDCKIARVFQAATLTSAGGIDNIGGTGTAESFKIAETEVMKYITHAYYVANGNTGPALFRHDGIAADFPDELVEGVENMQILYGLDTDATPDGVANRYDTADHIDFTTANIVSVRISLLMRSEKNLSHYPTGHTDYLLAGGTTPTGTTIRNADDQRLRKVFTTTIKIRNKGLL